MVLGWLREISECKNESQKEKGGFVGMLVCFQWLWSAPKETQIEWDSDLDSNSVL